MHKGQWMKKQKNMTATDDLQYHSVDIRKSFNGFSKSRVFSLLKQNIDINIAILIPGYILHGKTKSVLHYYPFLLKEYTLFGSLHI